MFTEYILDAFINSAGKFENRNAFCINEKFYSYREFAESISNIRLALQDKNIMGNHIGLVTNDDLETYAAIFALWMEGYAYVPLHPRQPIERSLEIMRQAEVSCIIDSGERILFPSVKTIGTRGLHTEKINLKPKRIPDDSLAYILFTSGSTGKPKGVPITRNNAGAFMKSFWDVGFKIDQNDRCLQCFDLTFDVSVQSFLVPLTRGACTFTIPHDQIKYSYVYGLMADHKITFGAMPPSMIRYLRPYFDEINIPGMRYNILTAEASPVELVEAWSNCIPHAEIYDFYGPTEATIYCTYYKFNRGRKNKQINGLLSIGKPMNGMTALIFDENQKRLKSYEKGELCIAGAQLTPGYWNNEERNSRSFFLYENGHAGGRFYRTGDLCYKDSRGDIMYCGRLDYQVKIQGYRVELGEIEYHARNYLKGDNAVAISFTNKTGNTEIALFLEANPKVKNDIINYLKMHLPYYMIPGKVITLDQFPLNANGKIDQNVLKKILTDQDVRIQI